MHIEPRQAILNDTSHMELQWLTIHSRIVQIVVTKPIEARRQINVKPYGWHPVRGSTEIDIGVKCPRVICITLDLAKLIKDGIGTRTRCVCTIDKSSNHVVSGEVIASSEEFKRLLTICGLHSTLIFVQHQLGERFPSNGQWLQEA